MTNREETMNAEGMTNGRERRITNGALTLMADEGVAAMKDGVGGRGRRYIRVMGRAGGPVDFRVAKIADLTSARHL